MANYHVTKDKESGDWRVKQGSVTRTAGYCDTQAEASRKNQESAFEPKIWPA